MEEMGFGKILTSPFSSGIVEIKDEIDSLRMTGEVRCTGESPPVLPLSLVINPEA
jgi:hypothetical protein